MKRTRSELAYILTEAQIRQGIKRALRMFGFAVWDLEQNRRTRQDPGLADLYVVGHGRCAWVEVKRPGGKQSGAQREFEAAVVANGGRYMVWTTAEDAMAWWQECRKTVAPLSPGP